MVFQTIEEIRSEARSRSVDLLENIHKKKDKYLYGKKISEIKEKEDSEKEVTPTKKKDESFPAWKPYKPENKDGRMVTFNEESELSGDRTMTAKPGNFYTLSYEQQCKIKEKWHLDVNKTTVN